MNSLLDHILESEDIFKPVSSEEIPIRRQQYLKSLFDDLEDEGRLTYNEDGMVNIKGSLYLYDIDLVSLLDLPYKIRKVTGSFSCSYNKLTTLKGAPEQVGGNFDCHGNQLTTLEGAPEQVGGNFICQFNKLTTLKGAPRQVGGDFSCSGNKLTTLEGAPRIVGGYFSCRDNNLPKNVEIPSRVKGKIHR